MSIPTQPRLTDEDRERMRERIKGAYEEAQDRLCSKMHDVRDSHAIRKGLPEVLGILRGAIEAEVALNLAESPPGGSEREAFTICSDCGFNLGYGHTMLPPVTEQLKVGAECPKCGEPMILVAPVSTQPSSPKRDNQPTRISRELGK